MAQGPGTDPAYRNASSARLLSQLNVRPIGARRIARQEREIYNSRVRFVPSSLALRQGARAAPMANCQLIVPPQNAVATFPSSIRPINLAVRRLPAATPGLGRCLPPW